MIRSDSPPAGGFDIAADLIIRPGLAIPAGELTVRTSRASGPGGQHVNTTDTRVQVQWKVLTSETLDEAQRERLVVRLASRLGAEGVLTVACGAHRSQRRNLAAARVRLAALVDAALQEPRARKPTVRSRAGHERRLERKRRRAAIKRLRRQLPED